MADRDYERELGGLQANMSTLTASVHKVGQDVGRIAENVSALRGEMKEFNTYQHERNHALGNGIETARGEVARAANMQNETNELLHRRISDQDKRITQLEISKGQGYAKISALSAGLASTLTGLAVWLTKS